MKNNQKIILFKTISFGFIYLMMFYVVSRYIMNKGFVSLHEINYTNIYQRLLQDIVTGLFFSIILLIKYHKNYGELGFTDKSKNLSIILFAVYLLFFILHSDYSIGGFYRAIFYLIMVGLHEEIIMRGYIYLKIKPVNRILAIIISGIFFGVAHAIMPGIIADKSISFIGLDMLNYIGGGIVSGILFITCMELSGNILVAILIHSILDYSYGCIGIIVLILTIVYLILENKRKIQ